MERHDHLSNTCYLAINASNTGVDAQDWAEILLHMYERYCERTDLKVSRLEVLFGNEAGIRSATLEIKGPNAYVNLKEEDGVHRLARISPFDSAHRRHISLAAVSVVPVAGGRGIEEIERMWGRLIRSYILHPYQMVKDHRTGMETGNVDAVLDGDITLFDVPAR